MPAVPRPEFKAWRRKAGGDVFWGHLYNDDAWDTVPNNFVISSTGERYPAGQCELIPERNP